VARKPRRSAQTFAEKYKSKSEKTAVIVGDSMVRGVGTKLKKNSQMFSCTAYGGARIEDVSKYLSDGKSVKTTDDSHVVVMVGTNNLRSDGTEGIREKYEELLNTLKDTRCRKRSVVGIFRRARDNVYLNSKRLAVNERLKKQCASSGVEYIDPDDVYRNIARSSPQRCSTSIRKSSNIEVDILDRWGLHPNDWGQDEIAAYLFKHCVSFLG